MGAIHWSACTVLPDVAAFDVPCCAHLRCARHLIVCVVMWGGRSFGLHTSKVRAKDRGHTYSLHRTHMGCLTWTVRAHVL
jgi:hypothetical protein